MKKIVITPNGKEIVDMTSEEISQRENDITNSESENQTIIDKETKKASGKQKLLDLGLTEDEVKALIGV